MNLCAFVCAATAVALPGIALIASERTPVSSLVVNGSIPEISDGTVNADMPPERFRGSSVSVVIFTDQKGIEEMCGKAQEGFVIIACHQKTADGVSVITMPNPCVLGESEFYAKIQCHENAHANGWSADHEQ